MSAGAALALRGVTKSWEGVVGLASLTLGMLAGLAALGPDGGGVDATMAVTLLPWGVYGALAAAWLSGRLAGRRLAQVDLGAFASVALVLSVAHFA